jgi:hypothetical protein
LPEFDVIVANGVWSWISHENRAAIVNIVRRKLAAGGMFYLSYNCTPGWSAAIPLRHLMFLHANLAGSGSKGILDRVDNALNFAQRVVDTGSGYFDANPAQIERLNAIKTQDRAYVTHEYFNPDWEPMPFSQVASLLAPANVGFAVSANLLNHVDAVSLPAESRKLLDEIGHPTLRESVRDYLINEQYRKDIFVKDGRQMAGPEQQERYLAQGFVLTHAMDEFPTYAGGSQAVITVRGAVITLEEDYYQPVIAALAKNNYAPKTLRELSTDQRLRDRSLRQLITTLLILTGAGIVRPTQDADAVTAARPLCKALNAQIISRLPAAGNVVHLASPVTGGGVALTRAQILLMQALDAKRQRPEDWARYAWANFGSSVVASVMCAKPIASYEESLAALTTEANEFAAKRLPVLQALEVV